MKILLISPASGKWHKIGRRKIFSGKAFRFSMLSLLTVAKLSPKGAAITIVDEQLDEIPWDEHFDVVGITSMTATAPRAYEIADHFRNKGIFVALGGFHPSLNQDEALEHADAVVAGSAFSAWPKLLEDRQAGINEKVYHGNPSASIPSSLPRELISSGKYITTNATYATFGCKNRCHFCSISAFYKAQYFHRNIEDVASEIAGFKKRFFIFVDDNLSQDRDYALELMTKLKPLKKKWVTQTSIDLADDDQLLGSMRDAGCVGVFIGLESFNDKVLSSQEKAIKAAKHYRNAVKKIHSYGLFVESGIIFGFDDDNTNVFESTFKMLEDIGIDAIQVSVLTPLPGTPLYDDMKGRIIDNNWEHYDYRHVLFSPKQMTPQQLQAGTDWVIRKYYTPWRIFRRFLRWMLLPDGWKNFIYLLVPNIAYYGRVKSFNIRGHNPAEKLPSLNTAENIAENSLERSIVAELPSNTTCLTAI